MLADLGVPASARLVAHDADPDDALTWPDIEREAARRAAEVPVPDPEKRVFGISAPNGVETILRIFSVISAGGIPAPLPPDTDPETLGRCLDRLDAAGLWTDQDGWKALSGQRKQPDGFDIVMHSSGSTGLPKPLAIRLAAMRRNARDVAAALDVGPGDVHIGTFNHCYMSGLYNATMLPLITGGRSVSLPQITPLNAAALIQALHRHRPTVLWLSPLVARLLTVLRGVQSDALRGLRIAISCTAPLPAPTKEMFEAKFRLPLLQSYGLCETLITTVEHPDSPCPDGVGRPIGPPGAVRLDNEGQIVIANGAHFAGYLDRPATADPAPVDPYETGDLGRIDETGNLYVLGRRSEIINRDGVKFAPEVIESVINTLPGVLDSAVVAIEDPRLGTRLIAMVRTDSATSEEMLAALRVRLPSLQQPHEIRLVDDLPRTTTGKIDRVTLKFAIGK